MHREFQGVKQKQSTVLSISPIMQDSDTRTRFQLELRNCQENKQCTVTTSFTGGKLAILNCLQLVWFVHPAWTIFEIASKPEVNCHVAIRIELLNM